MRVRPTDDRVLVRPESAADKQGSLLMPDSAKEKPQRGKVIAVGPGKLLSSGERAELPFECGDIIIWGKYCGVEIKIDNVDHLILRSHEIFGTVAEGRKK